MASVHHAECCTFVLLSQCRSVLEMLHMHSRFLKCYYLSVVHFLDVTLREEALERGTYPMFRLTRPKVPSMDQIRDVINVGIDSLSLLELILPQCCSLQERVPAMHG